MKIRSFFGQFGSSPLTRGTHSPGALNTSQSRFIPAYAGNSLAIKASRCARTVHPRLRGELIDISRSDQNIVGSSPLTRGTPVRFRMVPFPKRFIPAYAGNSLGAKQNQQISAVHPRLRGELLPVVLVPSTTVGSSPLTRGTPKLELPRLDFLRFIPAYAGNSV